MEGASPDLRRSFLDKACRACDELVLLQANIMDASRVEFDAATLCCIGIALMDICTAVIDIFEPWILHEQHQIKIDVYTNLTVLADWSKL